MPREKKAPPSGPNNGYLISFGDTMTALLAFFIVLNSLADDQTGANLHRGTGSFITAFKSFGLPGVFKDGRSQQAIQMEEWGPLYVVPPDAPEETNAGSSGKDPDSDTRIVDSESEAFQRFINELGRIHPASSLPEVVGEVSFDSMDHFPDEAPLLTPGLKETLKNVAPLLRQNQYTVEIVVWAPTPSDTAWKRTAEQASQLRQEAVAWLKPGRDAAQRLTSASRTWFSPTIKRPVASVVLRRQTLVDRSTSGGL
jgi:hypothetical protein